MEVGNEQKLRNVIPRWRDFRTTLALGELESPDLEGHTQGLNHGSLEEQLHDWSNNQSLSFATDLVGSGISLGQTESVVEAADFILSEDSEASDLQKRIARLAKDPKSAAPATIKDVKKKSGKEIIDDSADRVRRLRRLLRKAPRDPIRLVELSREYAILGSQKKAVRTMETAVSLAPSNRFVLRSAARLFVHATEIERAHFILKRSPALRHDPWLLAAEIAVASMLDRTSSHVRLGINQVVGQDYSAFAVSELASAIATLEMNNSNNGRARKLFRRALARPTDNTIAQAEWARRSIQNLDFEIDSFDVPRKYEALAENKFREGKFDDALEQGRNWILDQPFAVSPVLFTGFVSSVMEDFDASVRIYKFGVDANPENITLRNNLAFALASNNRPDLAIGELKKIDRTKLTIRDTIVLTATEGLINFRNGRTADGRELYRRAIEVAKNNKEPIYAMRALAFLAREEIHARTDMAKQTLEQASDEARNYVSKELDVLLTKLEQVLDETGAFPKFREDVETFERALTVSKSKSR